MGTEIQPKTYVPVYYSTRNLNDNARNGILALNREDKSLKNASWYDSLLTRSGVDGYLGCDKEQLRQTILKHESTFRHQLQELHRLYTRQRDLMNEIKRRELRKLPIPAETSQSSLFLSHFSSENAKKPWHVSNLPFADSTFGRPSASLTDSIQYPPDLTKGNNMSSPFPSQDQVIAKDMGFLESKCDVFHKRMFIHGVSDNPNIYNDAKQKEERVFGLSGVDINSLNRNGEVPREKDVNLSLGDGGISRGNLHIKRTHGLADLNEPVDVHGESISASVDNFGNVTCLEEEMQMLDVSIDLNSGFRTLSKDCSRSSIVGSNGGICLNNLHLENQSEQKEQFTYIFKAGQTNCNTLSFRQVVSPEDSNKLFKSSQVEPRKVDEPLALLKSNLSKTEPRRTRKIFGVEIPEENHNQSGEASHRDGKHLKICSSSIGFDSPSDIKAKTSMSDLSVPRVHMKYLKGLNCVDVKFEKLMNTNVVPLYKFHDEVIPKQNSVSVDGQRKPEYPKGGLPWLKAAAFAREEPTKGRENSCHVNLDPSRNYSQCLIQDSVSSTCTRDDEIKKIEVGDCPGNEKILGIPIFDMPHTTKDLTSPSSASKSSGVASAVDNDPTMKDLSYDNKSRHHVEAVGVSISGLSHQIDLNLCLYEEETPSPPSLPIAVLKVATTEIDLEAPAVLESEKDPSSEEDSKDFQLNEPPKLSFDESKELQEDPVWVAAEAIIAISSSNHPPGDSSMDSLHWFADIISSHKDDLEGHKKAVFGESTSDGMDYFEFMTLKLTETKVEDYCYNPPPSENQKDEETGSTLSPKRPRRGQARRGRQRRDFQKDILPGLVSLSRQEVTEDLQTIEELFRASGSTWQSSFSLRNAAKNVRGRRRRLGATTVICQPPLQQPVYREVGLEEKSLTGWGKRTRRLPRQRCPADNPIIALKC